LKSYFPSLGSGSSGSCPSTHGSGIATGTGEVVQENEAKTEAQAEPAAEAKENPIAAEVIPKPEAEQEDESTEVIMNLTLLFIL
jgi:hypothetical protein